MFCTKNTNTPSPINATRNETTNTASYPFGAARKMRNATIGPATAPAVSNARCTPKLVPRRSGSELSEMSASRGALRTPFPTRSVNSAADAGIGALRAASSPSLHAAEMPYPAPATSLYFRLRSAITPPAIVIRPETAR